MSVSARLTQAVLYAQLVAARRHLTHRNRRSSGSAHIGHRNYFLKGNRAILRVAHVESNRRREGRRQARSGHLTTVRSSGCTSGGRSMDGLSSVSAQSQYLARAEGLVVYPRHWPGNHQCSCTGHGFNRRVGRATARFSLACRPPHRRGATAARGRPRYARTHPCATAAGRKGLPVPSCFLALACVCLLDGNSGPNPKFHAATGPRPQSRQGKLQYAN